MVAFICFSPLCVFQGAVFKVLYGCKPGFSNQVHLKLARKDCEGKTACKVDASRKYFGNSECPGTDEKNMWLWVGSSCEATTEGEGKVAKLNARGYSGKLTCTTPTPGEEDYFHKLDVRPNV